MELWAGRETSRCKAGRRSAHAPGMFQEAEGGHGGLGKRETPGGLGEATWPPGKGSDFQLGGWRNLLEDGKAGGLLFRRFL